MEIQVRHGTGAYVKARIGRDLVWQEPVSTITTHTGARIVVNGVRSELNGIDVSDDAPAGDHAAIVSFWHGEATRWANAAAHLSNPASLPIEDGFVHAPGFTVETFTVGLEKARRAGYLNMRPLRDGSVRVDTGKPGSVYLVTRSSCSCKGSRSHGHCYHRAAVVACVDLYGIDVAHQEVLGFDLVGLPVTEDERVVQVQEAA